MNFIRKCLFALLLTLPLASCWESAESCLSCQSDQHTAQERTISETAPEYADTEQIDQLENPSGCPFPISEKDGWSPQEVWAWNERLCLGLEADMSELDPPSMHKQEEKEAADELTEAEEAQADEEDAERDKKCDVRKADAWPENRILSADFVSRVLAEWTDAKEYEDYDISISCARISEDSVNIVRKRNMMSITLQNVVFYKFFIDGNKLELFSVNKSKIGGVIISLSEAVVIRMEQSSINNIFLKSSKIDNIILDHLYDIEYIEITESNIYGKVSINKIHKKDCSILRYEFGYVIGKESCINLNNIKAFGSIGISHSDSTEIHDASLRGSLYIRGDMESIIDIRNVKISGNLEVRMSKFKGDFLISNVNISGNFEVGMSRFEENLQTDNLVVGGNVSLTASKFKSAVSFMRARIGGYLDAQGAIFEDGFNGDSMQVNKYLFLRNGVRMKGELNLLNASIGGNLELSRSEFQGDIILTNTDVGKMLRADDAQFLGNVIVKNMDISKSFFSSNSYFKKGLYAENASIEGELYLDESTFKGDVNLRRAKIGKYVSAQGVSLLKGFVGDAMHVEGPLFLRNDSVIKGDVNLLNASIDGNLEFSKSEFQGDIIAENLSVKKLLLANEARFLGRVDLTRADIGKSFIARGALFAKDLEALGIKVEGYVDFSQQYVRLDMPDEKYDLNPELRSCILNDACRKRVSMFGVACRKFPKTVFDSYKPTKFEGAIYMGRAEIGMYLDGVGSIFNEILNLEASDIKDGVFLRCGALFKQNVKLMGANIGYVVDFSKSTFIGNISMHAAKIFGHAFFHYGSYKEIDAGYSHLIRNIEFDGSHIDSIILNYSRVEKNVFARSGAHVNRMIMNGMQSSAVYLYDLHTGYIRLSDSNIGALKLGHKDKYVRWLPTCNGNKNECQYLDLRNAKVDVFSDSRKSWYRNAASGGEDFIRLDISGFQYERFGNSDDSDSFDRRPVAWLLKWLQAQKDHDKYYNPQPYEQLAMALEKAGHVYKAQDILYEKYNYQYRAESTHWITKVILWISWVTVGYGPKWYYNIFIFLIAFLLIIFVVPLLLWRPWLYHGTKENCGYGDKVLHILDIIMPLVDLKIEKNPLASSRPAEVWWLHMVRFLLFFVLTLLGAAMAGLIG